MSDMQDHFEIETDGQTVWVNTDRCVGRFGVYAVDIGMGLKGWARPDQTTAEDWERFTAAMLMWHDIAVPEKFRPNRLKTPLT